MPFSLQEKREERRLKMPGSQNSRLNSLQTDTICSVWKDLHGLCVSFWAKSSLPSTSLFSPPKWPNVTSNKASTRSGRTLPLPF